MRLTLYVKARCTLCDAAREAVEDVLDELGLDMAVEEVDVATDPALASRHRRELPVLAVDGAPAFTLRIDREALRARLAAELKR